MPPAAKVTNEEADRELLFEILYILKEGTDDERNDVYYDKIPRINNKQAARDELICLLSSPESVVRGWAATSLAKLCGTEDAQARAEVCKQLKIEEDIDARSWMLLALYRMADQNLKEIQGIAREIANSGKNKRDDRVRPLALAILTADGDRDAAGQLERMLHSDDLDELWYACRALEEVRCREMVEPLRRVALDPRMWPDIRNRSVRSLGYVESPTAAHVLGKVLIETHDPIVQETALIGLERLGRSPRLHEMLSKLSITGEPKYSVADSLLDALLDGNAQIRHRAAEALPQVMPELVYGNDEPEARARALAQARMAATDRVVKMLLRETVSLERDVPMLVDALRVIDPPEAQAAVSVLRDYLSSEDLSVRQRSEHTLKLVGGEKAVETLMAQKSEVLKAYNELLSAADKPVQELFEKTMEQAQFSFRISQYMSVTVFIIGIAAIAVGMWIAFTAGQDAIQLTFGAGTSVIAVVAVLLDMMYRDPHRRVQEATSVLLRTKVIFLGYVRQIHQVDATFKHEFIEGGKDFGVKEVQETVKQISEVMNNTMEMISQHLSITKTDDLAVDKVLKPWLDRLETSVKMKQDQDKTGVESGKRVQGTAEAATGESSAASIG